MNIIFLCAGIAIGAGCLKVSKSAGWQPAVVVGAALVPVAFTWFLGLIGLLISVAFLSAVWKAAA